MKYTSQIIAAGSGSVGGCVFSRNRYGKYVRNRSIPVNSQTAQQQTVRNLFGVYASRWTSTLTAAQRTAWNTYAANVGVVGPLGETQFLTGLNWYIACNTFRLQVGLATVDAAPTTFSLATFTPPPVPIVADDSSNNITVPYANTDPWATAVGGALAAYVSLPMSPSINFYKGPYRFAGVALGAVVPPTSPITIAQTTMVTGQLMALQLRACLADGRISAVQRYQTIVVA